MIEYLVWFDLCFVAKDIKRGSLALRMKRKNKSLFFFQILMLDFTREEVFTTCSRKCKMCFKTDQIFSGLVLTKLIALL